MTISFRFRFVGGFSLKKIFDLKINYYTMPSYVEFVGIGGTGDVGCHCSEEVISGGRRFFLKKYRKILNIMYWESTCVDIWREMLCMGIVGTGFFIGWEIVFYKRY